MGKKKNKIGDKVSFIVFMSVCIYLIMVPIIHNSVRTDPGLKIMLIFVALVILFATIVFLPFLGSTTQNSKEKEEK